MSRTGICVFALSLVLASVPGVAQQASAPGTVSSGAGPLVQQGVRFVKARNWPKALDAFMAAVRADPLHLDASFNAGTIAWKLNQCREALLYFRSFLFLSRGTDDDATARRVVKACEERKGATGRLTIRGEPRGAEVSLNGVLQARTPVVELKVPVGTWQLQVSCRCPDFEDATREVQILPEQETEVVIDLPRKKGYGELEIRTIPREGVEVLLDGESLGLTPLERVRLEIGKHFLELRKAGYDRWIRNVMILRDQVTGVDAELEVVKTPQGPGDGKRVEDGNERGE